MAGWPFLLTAVVMTLVVAFTTTLLEVSFGPELLRHTLRRWGKFLLLLVVLAIIMQFLAAI